MLRKTILFITLLATALIQPVQGRFKDFHEGAQPLRQLDAKEKERVAQLAKQYNFSTRDIQTLRDQGWGWGEISHIVIIANKANKPLFEVLSYRQGGLGWEKISEKYGFKFQEIENKVNEATEVLKGREIDKKNPAPDDTIHSVFINSTEKERIAKIAQQYNLSPKDIEMLRSRGWGWDDISHSVVIARKSGKPLFEIVSYHEGGLLWNDIAKKYSIQLKEVQPSIEQTSNTLKGKEPQAQELPHEEQPQPKEQEEKQPAPKKAEETPPSNGTW